MFKIEAIEALSNDFEYVTEESFDTVAAAMEWIENWYGSDISLNKVHIIDIVNVRIMWKNY